MKLHNATAEWFIPDGTELTAAIKRTTHMSIAAHQDDMEIMAYDGILKCFGSDDKWFTGVIVTNGAGSPRDDLYANFTDEQMRKIRKHEQRKAAYIGEYGALALLDYTSSETKDAENASIIDELAEIIRFAKPEYIYTHNLADKHDTHVSVALRVVAAIRFLAKSERPKRLYGCEVWRNLDWMPDTDKVPLDVSAHQNLAFALVAVHDSQICGGKRYDEATIGRRVANATYADSHGVDKAESLMYAMDLTPLIEDDSLDVAKYVAGYIDAFCGDVKEKIQRLGSNA